MTFLLAWVLLLKAGGALAQPLVMLSDEAPTQDISASSLMWIDALGASTAAEVVARGGSGFSPSEADRVYTLGSKAALWQHYRFNAHTPSHKH